MSHATDNRPQTTDYITVSLYVELNKPDPELDLEYGCMADSKVIKFVYRINKDLLQLDLIRLRDEQAEGYEIGRVWMPELEDPF